MADLNIDVAVANVPMNEVITQTSPTLLTRPTNHHDDVIMGLVDGETPVNKWGKMSGLGLTAVPVRPTVAVFNPLTDIITTAQTLTITYDNATDGLGTTGAVTLIITYIGSDDLEATAYHTMGNTGSDVSLFTTKGVNRVVALVNGAISNVNDITLTATIDATIQAVIPAGKGVTQQAIFHTEIGKTTIIDTLFLNAQRVAGGGADPKVTFNIYSWSRVVNSRFDVFEFQLNTATNEHLDLDNLKLPFGGREVIWVEAVSDKTDTFVASRFRGNQRLNP